MSKSGKLEGFERAVLSMLLTLAVSQCSLSHAASQYAPEVTERLGMASETPEWTYGAKVMWQDGDSVIFAHALEMSGDSRPDVCMKAASLQARVAMRRFITESISSSELLSQASLTSDPEFESVTASLAQGSIKGASVREQYWERLLKPDVRGERRLRMRCASQVQVTRSDLDGQLEQIIVTQTKNNPEMRRALITAQTDFLNNLD